MKLPDLNGTLSPLRATEVPELDGNDALQTLVEWLFARMAAGA